MTHPDTHERVVKLQKDVEEIKEELEDQWHERRASYEQRVRKALEGYDNCAILFLEIDGMLAISEIERNLSQSGRRMPHKTLWAARNRLVSKGLVKKIGVKGKSPIYAKKPWAKALDMDNYVRTKILKSEEKA